MHITQKKSILIAFSTLTIFFLGGIALLRSKNSSQIPQRNLTENPLPIEAEPTVSSSLAPTNPEQKKEQSNFILESFHRSETKDGKKLWEITSSQGEYFPETNSAQLQSAHLWFFKPNGDIVQINADQATIFLDGPSLSKAESSGNVVLVLNDSVTIKTDRADYNKSEHSVLAPGFVTIESARMKTTGNELRGDLESQEFTLLHNVDSVIYPRK